MLVLRGSKRMRAAVQVGADVTRAVQVSAENTSIAETEPQQEVEPAATVGRPEGSAAKPGKKQKSLFDF